MVSLPLCLAGGCDLAGAMGVASLGENLGDCALSEECAGDAAAGHHRMGIPPG